MILVEPLLEMMRITKRCVSSDLWSDLTDMGKNNCFGVDYRYKSGRQRSGLISFSDSFNFLLPWTIIIVHIKKFLLSSRCTRNVPAHSRQKDIISILSTALVPLPMKKHSMERLAYSFHCWFGLVCDSFLPGLPFLKSIYSWESEKKRDVHAIHNWCVRRELVLLLIQRINTPHTEEESGMTMNE